MDMFGYPMLIGGLLLIPPTDIGYTLMMDGHGFQITDGAGHHFIMAAGFTNPITDGYGFRIQNGDRDGLPGEDQMIIMVGRQ